MLKYRRRLAKSTSWVNIVNLFFKFVYASLCFKIKFYSSSGKSLCIFEANLLRRDFVFSLLIVTEVLGLELLVVIFATIQIKFTVCSCAAEALHLAELLVLSFVIGPQTSDEVFVVSKTFPRDWRETLIFPFLARSFVSTDMPILVALSIEVWVKELSCSIKILCVILCKFSNL